MKIQKAKTIGVIATLLIATGSAFAGPLTKREARKFNGIYLGQVSGIAGNTSSVPSNYFTIDTEVKVKSASRQLVVPLKSDLQAGSAHRLVFRKATGSRRRAKFVGIYVGTVTNPTSGIPESVSGTRTMIISDRGRGKNVRFIMRLSDSLREGSFSAQEFSGVLGKRR